MTVATDRMPDFTGYATRFDRECSDGRTIKHGAFLHQDGHKVPLVWQHQHDSPGNVLGHAFLYQREDGVYTEAFFNETQSAQEAKELVRHGDIRALSIFANKLRQSGGDVVHGNICEVSLVYKGANPDAYIQDINLQHSADGTDTMFGEVIIYPGEEFELYHAEGGAPAVKEGTTVEDVWNTLNPTQKKVVLAIIGSAVEEANTAKHDDFDGTVVIHADSGETIDVDKVIDSLNPVQRAIVNALIGTALEPDSVAHSDDAEEADEAEEAEEAAPEASAVPNNLQHNQEGSATMKYNAFEAGATGTAVAKRPTLSHSDIEAIVAAAKQPGNTYKGAFEDFIAHADYGIEDINLLFPDAKALASTPELIARQTEWVAKVLGATKHSPFAKVKTILADLTAEEARAKGYVKGTMKKEEVVKLLRRTTGPTTVYKKQKLDRDDIIDITDLDVVAWLKWEIRFMLNEELARSILIGDGRSSLHADKIKDPEGAIDGIGIRSIANDDVLYAHKVELAANVSADVMIDEITRARSAYRGSGSPTFYTTDKILTDLLLLKDKMGRRLYETEAALAAALRVKEIVAVEPMEEVATLVGVIVNLIDYTVGANKGGELSFFEDFDIDFNQHKYLLETRISGALTKPKSALVIRRKQGTLVTATAPSFNGATNTISIPSVTGVDYLIDGQVVTGDVVIDETTDVSAEAQSGFYLADNSTRVWTFTYTA